MGCEALSLDPVIPDIAVRLADEGVPLRAIARAIKLSSDVVREQLRDAQVAGRLLDLPRDDWPPGFPRDQRALQVGRLVTENRDQLLIAVQQLFNLTPTEIALLLIMVQHPYLLKSRLTDMSVKTLDVHVCRIRQRLEPYGIQVQTLWGQGFQFSSDNRRKVMDLILHKVSPHES
jgi:DNA-binding winged helix-turn-helix (wHTH) protein